MLKKTVCFFLLLFAQITFGQTKIKSDWAFIYYMPYDNNLSYLGDTIVSMIRANISSDKVVAIIQADFADSLGMTRFIITKDSLIKISVNTENSASTNTYKEYLEWISNNFEFQKSAIIFLNHGGKLDEVCLDMYPKQVFLKVDSLKNVLIDFNKTRNKISDLLFLQVCTKGSIEPLYEFREVANYTLASQTELGAPNYYYKNLFSYLSKDSSIGALEVAKIIVQNETDDMYDSYTCIANSAFQKFADKFSEFIQKAKSTKGLDLKNYPKDDSYADEHYWDLVSFLQNLILKTHKAKKIREELLDIITQKLIVIHQLNPLRTKLQDYCGLSLLANTKTYEEKMKTYHHLEFFSKFKISTIQLTYQIKNRESKSHKKVQLDLD